jgi:regulator of sigma E protease
MNFIWYLIWFVVAVGLLVTVHEFGHFWVARRLGFKVLRFSVGFGRPLLRRVAGADQVEYVVAAIPLGGYVKMLDEREGPVPAADLPRSFTRRPPWQRIAVLLAGPAFNILFAILVLWGMYWVSGITEIQPRVGDVLPNSIAWRAGLKSGDDIRAIDGTAVNGARDVIFGLLDAMSGRGETTLTVKDAHGASREVHLSVPDSAERRHLTEPAELFRGLGFEFWSPPEGVIGQVLPGGAAARAGLADGDRIVAINGTPVKNFDDIVHIVSVRPDADLSVTYRRAGAEQTVRLHTSAEAQLGGKHVGRIGVSRYPAGMILQRSLGPGEALTQAVDEAWSMTAMQARMFWRMVLGRVSLKNLSGPLSIAEYAGDSAENGVGAFLGFLVLISLSLGFLNLLPIPILDGGQIVFQLAEWLKGSPLSERAQAWGQQVGIALLIVLMGVALYNDFARQFS